MRDQRLRLSLAALLVVAALIRAGFHDALAPRMDELFVTLLVAAALVLIVPWERLTGLKAAGVEIALDQPKVVGAIKSLGLDRVRDERLRAELSRLEPEMSQLGGSRVLWIDDRPHEVVALRRLLRALDVEVVMTVSTAHAESVLVVDNDFDLIVSDVQRRQESEQTTFAWIRETQQPVKKEAPGSIETTDGRSFHKLHEGVNYVVRLRTDSATDPTLRSLPVLFYAAYDWPRLAQYTAVAVATSPDTEISNSPETFFPKAIRMLSRARTQDIEVEGEKRPT